MTTQQGDTHFAQPAVTAVADNSDVFAQQTFPPAGLVAQSRIAYQRTPLTVMKIRPGVLALSGAGGTVTAIRGSRGCTVIDTGYGPRVPEIRRDIAAALGQAPHWLIDTHWHFDHTDGNALFAAAGANIFAHSNCRLRLSRNQYVPSLKWSISASPRVAWPAITFDQPIALDIGAEALHLLPQAPAHTDGDLAVFLLSANVLVMGDLFTNGSYPVIDEASGGSLRGMIEAIDNRLPSIDAETVVVPGHGSVVDRAGVVSFRDMLRRIEDNILALIEAKLPIPEIITAQPSAEFDSSWGQGYVTGAHFTRMALAGMGLLENSATLKSSAR
jgi:cyclase